MLWIRSAFLTCLALLFITLFHEVDSANAPDGKANKKAANLQGGLKTIFMEERDATNFFKHRGRRSVKSQDELNIEQQQRLAAEKRKRDYHEEQMDEFENYAEEEHNEQDERTQESTEQWREFHPDGLDPPYEHNNHTV